MRHRASSSASGTGTRSCWCRFPTKLRSTSGRNLRITNGFRRTAAQAPTRWSCPSKQCRGPTEPIGSSGDENLQFVASTFHPHSRAPSDARHRSGVVGLRSCRGKGASDSSLVRLVEMAHHSAPAVGMFGDYVDSHSARHPAHGSVGPRSQIDNQLVGGQLGQHGFEQWSPASGQARLSRQF